VPAHQRTKRGRKPLDPALPRDVRRHELPEDERVCPHDGAALREIGVEVSEQLDVVPQQVRVIRHERVKYACPCCDGGLRLAPKPPQVIPKGLLSEAALAWVITSKYLDGLPLYRQPLGDCWVASAARSCRATRWPPASCGWARPRSR
jgi:transposase